MPKQIHVVGAVITRGGLVMCAQRGDDGNLPGLWEFPGGKIEQGESKQAALMREITEELGCTVEVGREVTTTTHEYEFGEVTLTTFYCRLVAGTPKLTEHTSIKWLPPDELETIPWAPADIPALALIRAELT
ncbi:MAG: NUDIX domain-containing protein [Actinobacteria bacterium]|uniref:8-oxo-dGTP diphosphatase n=1 Tax=freshwater metagenome TaxID=449393 RepID=A0A6J7J3H4_9ZZZZ|nr:NUDIX domain-containing protein [Actinomycetota bacterium]